MTKFARRATAEDISKIATIHREAFPRQRDSELWVSASVSAWPRILAYVFQQDTSIIGYVFWTQKSGIRSRAVLELDQVAVLSSMRGQGIGEQLIRESLALVESELHRNGQSVHRFLVSTRADNDAQRLYRRVLGAQVVAEVENLYSATEVFMVGGRVDIGITQRS